MKHLLIIAGLMLTFCYSKAQSFSPNFLENDFLLYKNVELTIKKDSMSGLAFSFYRDLKDCNGRKNYNVIYRDPIYPVNTLRDSLYNRTFIVEDIVDRSGTSLESNSILDQPIFILKDVKSGQRIFYKYDNDFPFDTAPIPVDQEKMCLRIEENVIKKTGTTVFYSPETSNNQPSFVSIEKHHTELKDLYYLNLNLTGEEAKQNGNGAYIYFTDGKRIFKQATLLITPNKKNLSYAAVVPLSANDLKKLSKKNIQKIKLHVHEKEITPVAADIFKAYVNCVMKAK